MTLQPETSTVFYFQIIWEVIKEKDKIKKELTIIADKNIQH